VLRLFVYPAFSKVKRRRNSLIEMKKPVNVLLIVLSIILLDQITKYLVISYLTPFDSIRIFSFLHI